ncbi:MAG TPA: Fur family transcriptional regulator [Anaerolineales bacterium]|nr:Fur family transcriptional regulator [Anaerolineales bacterium]
MSPCQTFIDALRARRYRITPQREMIIESIAHAGQHINAEEVFRQIQHRTRAINIATVYRTLDLLVEQGLASRIDLGEGRVIYATNQHGPHIHLVCRQCGSVTDANQDLLSSLTGKLQSRYQFAADLQHISILGLCCDCQAK